MSSLSCICFYWSKSWDGWLTASHQIGRGYTNYYSVAITLLDRLLNLLRHGTCPPGIGDGRIGVRASRTFHRERQRREYSDENRERGRSIASGSIWSRYERSGSWHCNGTALEQPTPLTNNCMRTCVRTRLCQLLLLTDHQKTKDYIDPFHSHYTIVNPGKVIVTYMPFLYMLVHKTCIPRTGEASCNLGGDNCRPEQRCLDAAGSSRIQKQRS